MMQNAEFTTQKSASGPEMGTAVEVADLSHAYGKGAKSATILKGIDLQIPVGQFVSIMGPSGCGKTTLLNLMAGFERPGSGTIRCHGEKVRDPGTERGVVLQKPALFPWMSVIENVMFGLKATGQSRGARTAAEALLADVGLKGYGKHKTYQLSGGMQHRVAIARTLALKPDVLLMDEPFGALDAQTRTEMQTFLLDLWQHHRSTVVFVTHDIEEGLLLSDRIVVLGRGDEGVRDIIDVDISRPRTYETALTPEFIDLRRQLKDLITG